jgi:hypothetical protein
MAEFGRTLGEIADDEPVFVVRARDRAAPASVRAYASEAERLGASPRLVASARAHADAMEQYQAEHGSKIPDL